MRVKWSAAAQYIAALAGATGVGACLLVAEALNSGNFGYIYIFTNVILAWIPFGLAIWLQRTLQRKRWSSWQALALSAAWLAFLPNSFYMVSDFIHLN